MEHVLRLARSQTWNTVCRRRRNADPGGQPRNVRSGFRLLVRYYDRYSTAGPNNGQNSDPGGHRRSEAELGTRAPG